MTEQLFHLFTDVGAGWVMYLLIGLSVLSVALMLERLVFFYRYTFPQSSHCLTLLAHGQLEEARRQIAGKKGMEVFALQAAIDAAPGGAEAVDASIASVIAHQKPFYERYLSFLGTLGNNAPFIGLFGTVIGIIKAFADLSIGGAKAAGATAVMAGISEALVATAVGIFVAIPAVVAFNGYNRWLKIVTGRTQALGFALAAHLKKTKEQSGGTSQERLPRAEAA